MELYDLELVEEAQNSGLLTQDEFRALLAADLILVGGDRSEPGYPETVVAVEVSRTIDDSDLDRAERRAALLRKAGLRARPAVGGKVASDRVQQAARDRNVIVRLPQPGAVGAV